MKLSGAARALLWPASLVWNVAARARAAEYRVGLLRARRLPGTVISVGNLTAGGTGKTPIVMWIAERLQAEGHRVGILTRGYKGSPDSQGGEPQSDEVAILRARLGHHVSLGVGANRYDSGLTLARHGVTHFVLDDGFQHLELARDADIVMIDATDPFGGNRLLPAGLLREPKSALRRADIVVITRSDRAPAVESLVKRHTKAPIFYATTDLLGIYAFDESAAEPSALTAGQISAREWFAFSGIGNPKAFTDDLGRWGIRLCATSAFPDHHRYSERDTREIETDARDAGATALICTEKDLFNFRGVKFATLPVYFAKIALKISAAETFWTAVQSAITRHRGASAA